MQESAVSGAGVVARGSYSHGDREEEQDVHDDHHHHDYIVNSFSFIYDLAAVDSSGDQEEDSLDDGKGDSGWVRGVHDASSYGD